MTNGNQGRSMMNGWLKGSILCTAAVAASLAVPVGTAAQQLEWSGSTWNRLETRHRNGDIDGGSFTSMQTRLGVARALNADARFFVQFQDARVWGSERNTTDGSADNFDLHQGYIELGHRGTSPLWLRAGRQEMEFGEGRLVGAPVWSMLGQSFDALRAAWSPSDRVIIDGFISDLGRNEVSGDTYFMGLWSEVDLGEDRSLQLFALHDRNNVPEGILELGRTTFGTWYEATTGVITYRVEGALQTGIATGRNVTANMVGVRIGAPLLEGKGTATLWYDRYSGDANPGQTETKAFSDLFGRNHPFFGKADLFSDIPTQTNGRGIQDLALKLGWKLPKNAELGLDLHRLMLTDDAGLDEGKLADEVDLTITWPASNGIDLLVGGSWVNGTPFALTANGGDRILFGFAQLRARF